jgi:hypothetical protein
MAAKSQDELQRQWQAQRAAKGLPSNVTGAQYAGGANIAGLVAVVERLADGLRAAAPRPADLRARAAARAAKAQQELAQLRAEQAAEDDAARRKQELEYQLWRRSVLRNAPH